MNENLFQIKTNIYDKIRFEISNFEIESQSKTYDACKFELDGWKILSRSSKITPKKIGQFVTFWKRGSKGIIEPYSEKDEIDFYIINTKTENKFGQFVFPKALLVDKGILSTTKKEGKRGFRVYPSWDIPSNKQAKKTQKWQCEYFYEVTQITCLAMAKKLYQSTYSR